MDELFNTDPNKFFLALAKKSPKLPFDFNTSTIVEEVTKIQTQGPSQKKFTQVQPISQQMFTSLPLGATTHIATTTHIPNPPIFGAKRTHATSQGPTFTFGSSFYSSSNSMGATFANPFSTQNTTPSINASQNLPNKTRRIHIVTYRVPTQMINATPNTNMAFGKKLNINPLPSQQNVTQNTNLIPQNQTNTNTTFATHYQQGNLYPLQQSVNPNHTLVPNSSYNHFNTPNTNIDPLIQGQPKMTPSPMDTLMQLM